MCESMGLNGLWCTRPVFDIVKRGIVKRGWVPACAGMMAWNPCACRE